MRRLPDDSRIMRVTQSTDRRGRTVQRLEPVSVDEFVGNIPAEGDPLGQFDANELRVAQRRRR
jgi:hypothetical protein